MDLFAKNVNGSLVLRKNAQSHRVGEMDFKVEEP